MPTTIKLKNSVTTTNAPSSLVQGEVAINITDKKVWVGNAATTPIQLLGDGASLNFTSLTLSANLNFTGTGNRITGDFSNATIANRVAFQSSTTNGNTALSVIPNGTGTQGIIDVYANSDPTNTNRLQLISGATFTSIRSGISGTGTYQPLTIFTSGSEVMRIDTSGNVGIGNSSPSHILDVSNTSATNKTFRIGQSSGSATASSTVIISNGGTGDAMLRFDYEGTNTDRARIGVTASNQALQFFTAGNNERMRIDSSGNVGIGTSSPSYPLQVVKNANGAQRVLFSNNSSGSAAETVVAVSNGTAEGSIRVAGTSYGGYGAYTANNTLIYNDTSAITIMADNASNGVIKFATGSNSERMRIDSSGNVSIGTSTAFSKFGVSTTNGNLGITGGNTSGGNKIQSFGATTTSNGYLAFEGYSAEYMRIDSSGNVGIGTSSPTRRLHLYASATCDMTIQAGNTTDYSYLYFGDSASATQAWIGYYHTEDSMRFATNAAERMRITSGGDLLVGTTTSPVQQTTTAGSIVATGSINSLSGNVGNTTTGTSYNLFTAVQGASYIVNINAANTCSVYLVTCESASSAVTNTPLLVQNGANITNSGTTIRFTNNFGGNLNDVGWSAIRLI